jgi:aminoglycoside phosphotransferase family enzyme
MLDQNKSDQKNIFVPLNQKVDFLKQADTYRKDIKSVRTIETHMSWLFITDIYVYKLKKPNSLPYLDFSSLEKRKDDCFKELELNQQLAADTYLDVVSLNYDEKRQLHLGGSGRTVDWLVKMRKLDDSKMLDQLISEEAVPEDGLKAAADLLMGFYQQAEPVPTEAFAYWNKLLDGIRDSYAVLMDDRFDLPLDLIKEVVSVQQSYLMDHDSIFEERVNASRIIEGHGDLRPEHICLEDKPVIFDCLEFNDNFRQLDPLDELAFLDMECERIRNNEVGKFFRKAYTDASGDNFPEPLWLFYKSKRATLRAKLSLQHLDDKHYTDKTTWVDKAHDYLSLAKRYTDRMHELV